MKKIALAAALFLAPSLVHAEGAPWKMEYMSAMDRMDQSMKQADSPDPDVAFAEKMIPHHQGAIDMAKIQLKYGKSEQARQEARDIIVENEKSTKKLQAFIDGHKQ